VRGAVFLGDTAQNLKWISPIGTCDMRISIHAVSLLGSLGARSSGYQLVNMD
jgi:hypothetical protein